MGNTWTASDDRCFHFSDGTLIKSKNSLNSADLTLRNDTPYELHVFWLDYYGDKVLYGTLPANGGARLFNSYLTHPWTFEVPGRPELVPVCNDKRVVFPAPGGQLAVITMARPMQWHTCLHRDFAGMDPLFGQATKALLLCHHVSHNAVPAAKVSKHSSGQQAGSEEEAPEVLLGRLPMDVLLAIVRLTAPALPHCAPIPPSDMIDLPPLPLLVDEEAVGDGF